MGDRIEVQFITWTLLLECHASACHSICLSKIGMLYIKVTDVHRCSGMYINRQHTIMDAKV